MSYLIKNNEIVAYTTETLKSGDEVMYAYDKCKEALNADRDYNLVNAKYATISNAKKWDRKENDTRDHYDYADEINAESNIRKGITREFLVL